jgi:hypothetical protein
MLRVDLLTRSNRCVDHHAVGGFPMSVLSADIASYERMRPELEANHRLEWVVFHAGQFVDVYPDFDAAAFDAIDRFDSDSFLIRQVGAPPQVQLTGGMVFTRADG